MNDRSTTSEPSGDRFSYFMLRIHDSGDEGRPGPSGIIERLGTGRKQSFTGTDELIRLLTETPETVSKMRVAPAGSNQGTP